MRKNVLRNSLCLLLCAALAGNAAANGTKDQGPANATAGKTAKTTYGEKKFDNVTITVEVFDRSNAPAGSTVVSNRWTKYVNQEMNKVGITVNFVAVPRSEEEAKIQIMMAAGTAPDVMLAYSNTLVEDYFNMGGTYDLSPYVDGDGQAKNLKAYIGKDIIDIGRNTKGQLWSIPARRATTASQNTFIRKDWLDKLGMKIPTTPDELYKVLYAFKNNNPDGIKNVIASSIQLGYKTPNLTGTLAMAFMKSTPSKRDYEIADSSYNVYADDGYIDFMRFLNKLYNDGLMDKEYYVGTEQTLKEQIVSGRLGYYEGNVNGNVDTLRGALLQNLKANYPNAEFVSMPPLKNVHDVKIYNAGYPANGAFLFVPKTCKNPEAVVTYLDWLATKAGGFVLFHGFENEHYTLVNGVPVVKDLKYNLKDKDWTRHDLFLVGNQGYYATQDDFTNATSKELPGYEKYVIENYKNATVGTVRATPTWPIPTAAKNKASLDLIREDYHTRAITCLPKDFDSIIVKYREKLKENGMDQIMIERSEYYTAKFGTK